MVLGRPFLKKCTHELDFVREEFHQRRYDAFNRLLAGLPNPQLALISAIRGGRECKKQLNEVFTVLVRSISSRPSAEAGVVDKKRSLTLPRLEMRWQMTLPQDLLLNVKCNVRLKSFQIRAINPDLPTDSRMREKEVTL